MGSTVRGVWVERVKPVVSRQFYVTAVCLSLGPPVLFQALDGATVPWFGGPVLLFLCAVGLSVSGLLALQLRVYRAAIGAETTEVLLVDRFGRDTARVAAVTLGCVLAPVALLSATSVLAGPARTAVLLASALTLVAGAYVYPAVLSRLVPGRPVRTAFFGPTLYRVLRSRDYALHWACAVLVSVGSLFLFAVATFVLFLVGGFVAIFATVSVPSGATGYLSLLAALLFLLAAPALGTLVSVVAATGVLEADPDRSPPVL